MYYLQHICNILYKGGSVVFKKALLLRKKYQAYARGRGYWRAERFVMRRKSVAGLLAVLLWFASGQTMVALHFCGGNLRTVSSVGVVEESEGTCCAGNGYADRKDNGKPAFGEGLCCAELYGATGGDDFTQEEGVHGSTRNEVGTPLAVFIPVEVYGIGEGKGLSYPKNYPPPDRVRVTGAEWLIFICTFRI
jgi:hypothetical protein